MVGIVEGFGLIWICMENVRCLKKRIEVEIVEVGERLKWRELDL